jgi:hypothetical protein
MNAAASGSGLLGVGATRRCKNPIRGTVCDCCASADEQSVKSIVHSAIKKVFLPAESLIKNPKPVLSKVEVSKIQNEFIESPCPPAPVHSAESLTF